MTRLFATRARVLALLLGLSQALFLAAAPAAQAEEHLVIELKSGRVVIDLLEDLAPGHVARVSKLASEGAYDGIAFHRVIEGFMAQTGDVQFGKLDANGAANPQAGFGGSSLPDLEQEFTRTPMVRGMVGAARGGNDVNSANSQFFIMLEDKDWMNQGNDIRAFYTAWGRVIEGMAHVDNIQLGDRDDNGAVAEPDVMIRVYLEPAGS
ncbi:MAG: peptidylprolyl isomerase [Pseudomonadota bacterium]